MPAAVEGTGRRSGRTARRRSASLLGMQRVGTPASYSVQYHFLSGAGAEHPMACPAGSGSVVRDREDKSESDNQMGVAAFMEGTGGVPAT